MHNVQNIQGHARWPPTARKASSKIYPVQAMLCVCIHPPPSCACTPAPLACQPPPQPTRGSPCSSAAVQLTGLHTQEQKEVTQGSKAGQGQGEHRQWLDQVPQAMCCVPHTQCILCMSVSAVSRAFVWTIFAVWRMFGGVWPTVVVAVVIAVTSHGRCIYGSAGLYRGLCELQLACHLVEARHAAAPLGFMHGTGYSTSAPTAPRRAQDITRCQS